MTIRNWLFLFSTTLSLAAWRRCCSAFAGIIDGEMGLTLSQQLLAACCSVPWHRWGYLHMIFNSGGRGLFPQDFWFNTVQVLLLLLVLGEVIVFGYMADDGADSWFPKPSWESLRWSPDWRWRCGR